jgi:hypothetical protein
VGGVGIFGLGVAKAPLQIRHETGVGALRGEVVWVLNVEVLVGAACRVSMMGHNRNGNNKPKIGPPLPLPSMGCPCRN